jgi:hypothetical protein
MASRQQLRHHKTGCDLFFNVVVPAIPEKEISRTRHVAHYNELMPMVYAAIR